MRQAVVIMTDTQRLDHLGLHTTYVGKWHLDGLDYPGRGDMLGSHIDVPVPAMLEGSARGRRAGSIRE